MPYIKRFLEAAIVSDILALCIYAIHLQTILRYRVIVILIDNTLSAVQVLLVRFVIPPVLVITILVKLPTTVVKSVRDLVSNNKANRTEV